MLPAWHYHAPRLITRADSGVEKKYPSELKDRFIVRMPEGMRDQIAEHAAANHRSMNSEIIARLQASLGAEQSTRTSNDTGSQEDLLLAAFRKLPSEKRSALLRLLK